VRRFVHVRAAIAGASLGKRPANPYNPRVRRSRAAIAVALATGMLLSGASSAQALTALTTDLTATAAQYGQSPLEQPGAGRRGPGEGGPGFGGPGDQGGGGGPEGPRLGGAGQNGVPNRGGAITTGVIGSAIAQPAGQLAAGRSQNLPFTGLAAIPVLLGGLAFLTAGLTLRRVRRARTQL
jgi:hypothetical protein